VGASQVLLRNQSASHVAFAQHLGQVLLGPSSRTVDGAVVVAPFASSVVASEENAH
jgi:hypothetical protein